MLSSRRRLFEPADAALLALTTVFLALLVWGLVESLLRLRGLTYAGDRASEDASALFYGQPLYGDPTRGYVASVYTPLLPVLGATLDHVVFWRTWTPLISLASSLVMLVVIARIAYSPAGRRKALAVVEAAGVGAVLYWVVSELAHNYFSNDKPDQLAWTLGVVGLTLLPRARRSDAWLAIAVVVFSAAFWAKQTSFVAAVAALIVLVVDACRRRFSWSRVAAFVAALLAFNALLVFCVNQITGGWFVREAFTWPQRQPCCEFGSSLPTYLKGFTTEFTIQFFFGVLLFLAILAAIIVASRRFPSDWRSDAERAFPFAVLAVLALAAALVTRRRLGAAPNHELGIGWAAALLIAVGFHYLRRSRGGTVMLVAITGVLLVGSQVIPSRQLKGSNPDGYLTVGPLRPQLFWQKSSKELAAYATKHVVFAPGAGDISAPYARQAFPTFINLTGDMYVGETPDWLAHLLIDRRFDLVFPYTADQVANPLTSGNGRYEQNYLWKLNRVMQLEYQSSPKAPDGGRLRVRGPDPAPWLRHCFGPYLVSGVALRQHIGGGFWCPNGSTLTLRDTPASFADVRSNAVDVGGTLRVSLRSGSFRVALERGRHIVWQRAGRAHGTRRVAVVDIPATNDVRLSIGATRGSAAAFDLSRVTTRQF